MLPGDSSLDVVPSPVSIVTKVAVSSPYDRQVFDGAELCDGYESTRDAFPESASIDRRTVSSAKASHEQTSGLAISKIYRTCTGDRLDVVASVIPRILARL